MSSVSRVELCRLKPCSAAQRAVRAGARAPPDPRGQPRRLRGDRETAAEAAGALGVGVGHGRAVDRGQEDLGLLPGEVGVGGAGRRDVPELPRALQGRLGRSPGDPELQPAAGDEVGGGGLLGHVQRVLVAHVDDAGADLDAAGSARRWPPAAGTGGELALEVVDAHERAVDAELLRGLGELDGLQQAVGRGAHLAAAARLPVPEREEPDLRHGGGAFNHRRTFRGSPPLGCRRGRDPVLRPARRAARRRQDRRGAADRPAAAGGAGGRRHGRREPPRARGAAGRGLRRRRPRPRRRRGGGPGLLVAVKPQDIDTLLDAARPARDPAGHLVVSVAAGMPTGGWRRAAGGDGRRAGHAQHPRAGRGGDDGAVAPARTPATPTWTRPRRCSRPSAGCVRVPETQLDAVTALSGSAVRPTCSSSSRR